SHLGQQPNRSRSARGSSMEKLPEAPALAVMVEMALAPRSDQLSRVGLGFGGTAAFRALLITSETACHSLSSIRAQCRHLGESVYQTATSRQWQTMSGRLATRTSSSNARSELSSSARFIASAE